jgi:hypothetical protein
MIVIQCLKATFSSNLYSNLWKSLSALWWLLGRVMFPFQRRETTLRWSSSEYEAWNSRRCAVSGVQWLNLFIRDPEGF